MKTYDEAFRAVVVAEDGTWETITPERQRQIWSAADDRALRFADLVEEVFSHKPTEAVLKACLSLPPREALYAAFEVGLRIGMEMEKQEVIL